MADKVRRVRPAPEESTRPEQPAGVLDLGPGVVVLPSTEAQNEFGRVMEQAANGQDVAITRRHVPRVVVVSAERYRSLVAASARPALDALAAEFDALYASMQVPGAGARRRAALLAPAADLGAAAVAAARARQARHAPGDDAPATAAADRGV